MKRVRARRRPNGNRNDRASKTIRWRKLPHAPLLPPGPPSTFDLRKGKWRERVASSRCPSPVHGSGFDFMRTSRARQGGPCQTENRGKIQSKSIGRSTVNLISVYFI